MSIVDRMREAIGIRTQQEVAEIMEESLSRVNSVLNGKQRVPEDFLVKFIEKFKIDANWLMLGTSPVPKVESSDIASVEPRASSPQEREDTLGNRIKHIRGKINQADFAKFIGVSKKTLIRYEKDENEPAASVVKQMCMYTGIDARWLLFGGNPVDVDKIVPVAASGNQELTQEISELTKEFREQVKAVRELIDDNRELRKENKALLEENKELTQTLARLDHKLMNRPLKEIDSKGVLQFTTTTKNLFSEEDLDSLE